mmetsp:Transcript_87831/g.251613  ORF Transcript_87831/g.251613 Transcript_87831/m.251613 type:complete len:690 (+) Transcript_87831:87-2156(+)
MNRASVPITPPEPPNVDSLFAPASRKVGGGGGGAKGGSAGGASPSGAGGSSPSKSPSKSRSGSSRSAVKELSDRYMQTHRLETWDRLGDGFCDLASDGVLMDRTADETLDLVVTKAQQKMAKASDIVTALMALGLFVSETCGRSGRHAADLEARCKRRLEENRRSDGKVLLGSLFCDQGKKKKILGAGLSRHRALTFKLLADCLGTAECTVERDPRGTTAWNTVVLNETGYVVDLMHDPGALYEAGSAKQQEYVKMLSIGFGGLEGTLSTQKELAGQVPRPAWHVEATDLVYGQDPKDRLGKGGFGEVLKGTWADASVAIKVIKDKDPTDYDVLDFVLEIALLSRLSHPNVMRFWRGCAMLSGGKRSLLMVTEHIDKGGLSGVIHGHGGPKLKADFTIAQILVLALGIARGMQYLHSCNVLHLDLKSPNVLIDSSWTPKLCDFGLAKISMQEVGEGFQTTLRGVSPIWAPPEMFDDRSDGMTDKADVYSMGIVFFELATRTLPFSQISQRQLPKSKYEGVLPTIPKEVPEDFAGLVKACCAHRPGSRPSMAGVVARIGECAKARSVDFMDVAMPSWGPEEAAGEGGGQEKEVLQQLQQRQAQLQKERRELQAQVERTREQRQRLQQLHLGGSGIAEEGVMPQLSGSPRSPGACQSGSLGIVGSGGVAKLAGTMGVPAVESSKQACCASQ